MRPRTIILALVGVLFFNTLIVLGVWSWFSPKPPVVSEGPGTPADGIPSVATDIEAEPERSDELATPGTGAVSPAITAPAASATWAAIDSPRDGDSVSRRFRASGRCGPVPAGSRLMLVVDSGRGVYSPKMPPLTVDDGNWSGTVGEFGAPVGGSFSLCVFAVSDDAVQQITAWHAQGRATGKYPPFRQGVPGGTPLARIKLRVGGEELTR